MHAELARRKAERDAEELGEVEHLHLGLLAELLLGAHLVHLRPEWQVGHSVAMTSAPAAFAARRMLSTRRVEVSLSESVRAAAARGLQREVDVLRAGGGEEIVHEVRLRGGFAARPRSFSERWRGRVYMQP